MATSHFIEAEGLFNARDVGGYRSNIYLNGSIRKGVLYRSGHLAGITPSGLETLQTLGISTILDFTSPGETEIFSGAADVPPIPEWAQDIRIPFKEGLVSIAMETEKYKRQRVVGPTVIAQGYFQVLKSRPEVVRAILLTILDNLERGRSSFLIHCALGKDRTGLVCALLLSLAGVPNDIVSWDYSLSEAALQHLHPRLKQLILDVDPEVDDLDGLAYLVIECREETMMATLQMVREEYGGVYEYVRDCCGIDHTDIMTIRRALVTFGSPQA